MKRKKEVDEAATGFTKMPKLAVIPQFEVMEDALDFLHSSFPSSAFTPSMRPVLLKSQLYALINDRTSVDKQLSQWQNASKIRLLKLEDETDESVAFQLAEDYRDSFRDTCPTDDTLALYKRFSDFALNENRHLSVTKDSILKQFSDKEISGLVQVGALTIRSVGVWWISSPVLGRFLKTYKAGQRELLTMLRRKRFKELLLSDIIVRKSGKTVRLGHMFHILAHIGAGTLINVPTSSGELIRLRSG
ncbi:Serine/threonine-protein kinase 19 [Fasciola gigantica]|uniref:Serine/threonine-protein kinase 19 n=1 Tax=Fasciola gigantica TaxID=46835 RepID=A0A504YQ59_FASGI|nr:Serine/threonine-protein kinase 19 [Fasciola gigantica]